MTLAIANDCCGTMAGMMGLHGPGNRHTWLRSHQHVRGGTGRTSNLIRGEPHTMFMPVHLSKAFEGMFYRQRRFPLACPYATDPCTFPTANRSTYPHKPLTSKHTHVFCRNVRFSDIVACPSVVCTKLNNDRLLWPLQSAFHRMCRCTLSIV